MCDTTQKKHKKKLFYVRGVCLVLVGRLLLFTLLDFCACLLVRVLVYVLCTCGCVLCVDVCCAMQPIPANSDIDDDERHIHVRAGLRLGAGSRQFKLLRELGKGTFGKVVLATECGREDAGACAVKVVRAIDKYRAAARLEVEVLQTMAAFDPHSHSYCVALQHSFEWRSHVCMGVSARVRNVVLCCSAPLR